MRYETFDEFVYSKTIIKIVLMISLCKNDNVVLITIYYK